MIKMLKYLKLKEWLLIIFSLVFIVVQVWLDLSIPDYMYNITKLVQTEGSSTNDILKEGAMMLLCTLGSILSAIAIGFLVAIIGSSFSRRLRKIIFEKVCTFSFEEMNHFSKDSLITRSTNDIIQIQSFITTGISLIVKAPIMVVWAVIKMYDKGAQWTLATFIAVIVMVTVITILMILVMPKFKKTQTLTDDLNRVTRENLTGLRVVKAYNASSFQEQKFEKTNQELTKTYLFASRSMAVMMPMMSGIMSVMSLCIYWIGAVVINATPPGSFITVGGELVMERISIFSSMTVFTSYAAQVIMSFIMLVMIFIILPRAMISAKRVNQVLDTKNKIEDGFIDQAKGLTDQIIFNNVSFKYQNASEYVLKDINFTVKKGQTVAFIGTTGSGKSTLINLIPRFFEVTEGEILVDGVNVKNYTGIGLRKKIGYVSQKAMLFRGSIYDNVNFGDNNKDLDAVIKAIDIAQGTEFVTKMPNQYQADVAQAGANLSGGQKQRLAIARAIARDAQILIFDDSFSALDYKTDRILRSALKNEVKNVTSLIVAQRIGTILDADKIIVLEDGKIVGMGTHQELLSNCLVYKEIAKSQLNEKELGL